jgi:hypothetical protein
MHDLLAEVFGFVVDVTSYLFGDAAAMRLDEAIRTSEKRPTLKKKNG